MKKISTRGCLIYGIGFFFGLPLLLLAIGFLLMAGRERSAKRKLNDRLDKIAAQGLPVDNETMLSFTNSLTSKEYTKEWLDVLGELTSEQFAKSTSGVPIFEPTKTEEELFVPVPGQAWESETVTRDFISKWNDLRSDITKLSLKQLEPGAKPVRFLTEFNSIGTLLPQTQNMRSAARLLMLNGQVAIYDRHSARTRLSIEALLGCSNTVAGEPILVSQLVRNAIGSMGVEILRSALEHDVLSEKDLIALLPRMLDGIRINPQWKLAMQGERAMVLPVFKHPEVFAESEGLKWLPGRSTDALYYLDFMDRVLAVPDGDFDEFKAGLDKIDSDLRASSEGNVFQRFDSIMTSMMLPAVSAAGGAYIREAVQRRMAALSIGIRIYEKRNGKMPANLDDLKSLELGEFKLDPADLLPPGGAPFGYRVEENQVLLWGFELSQASTTPAEPPPTAEGVQYAALNKLWIWTLRTKKVE